MTTKRARPDRTDPMAKTILPVIAGSKPTNNKNAAAVGKPTFGAVPPCAFVWLGVAMEDGRQKYGIFNWRDAPEGISMSLYLDAMERHRLLFMDGEWADQKTGVPHLAYIMAGCAILLDGYQLNKLIDDRGSPGDVGVVMDEVQTILKQMSERNANK